MRAAGALGLILAIIFGLLGVAQLDGLQTSLATAVSGPLQGLINSFGFILLLDEMPTDSKRKIGFSSSK